jgi:predicted membrane metal-binding protein
MLNRLYHISMALLYILRCSNIFVEIYVVLFFLSTYYVALLYICLVNNKHILYLFVVSHFLLFLISSAGFVFVWETCGTYVSSKCENRCHLIL